MKFLKNTALIIALCILTPINAKKGGAAPAARPVAQPEQKRTPIVKQPIPQQKPAAQAPTFKSLMTFVKNSRNAWNPTNKTLNTDFVNSMVEIAREGEFDAMQLQTLLQTARDMHGIFSDNKDENIEILHSLNNQIDTAIQQL